MIDSDMTTLVKYHHKKVSLFENTKMDIEQNLQKYFNFKEFRPGQREIVETIIAGRDTVALMPTGGGKSLCYQLPAVMLPGLTVIISPLIALMKDQVDALSARGIPATFLNSSIDAAEAAKRVAEIKAGRTKILYIAPERLAAPSFARLFSELDISFLAVDEAHCVSQWGHDFRPDYLNIKKHLQRLKNRPIVAAFTATATPEVKNDIIERLGLLSPAVFVRGFDRPNLKFFVQKNIKPKERYLEVLRLIRSIKGSGIVYALTRKETETLADFLSGNGIPSTAYHAGLAAPKREKIQNDFMENRFKVIAATVAFGMGVDKADVRFVIHSGMPGSLEGYYQEAGRAGRDDEEAYCILLHSKKDTNMHNFFLRGDRKLIMAQGKSWEEAGEILEVKYQKLDKMMEYVESAECRRRLILKYFDDPEYAEEKHNCRGCDVCLKWKKKTEEFGTDVDSHKAVKRQLIGGTVKETVRLFEQGHTPLAIAKMRSLGESTIMGHLIDWYVAGGEVEIERLVSSQEEDRIAEVIMSARTQRLKPIKELLPENISYEKIRLVLAKLKRESQA